MIYAVAAVVALVALLVMSIMRVSGKISEDERVKEDARKYKREDGVK